jgi:hypothetical protein
VLGTIDPKLIEKKSFPVWKLVATTWNLNVKPPLQNSKGYEMYVNKGTSKGLLDSVIFDCRGKGLIDQVSIISPGLNLPSNMTLEIKVNLRFK